MDKKYLLNLHYNNMRAIFLTIEDAFEYAIEINTWCNRSKRYCEYDIVLGNKTYLVDIDIWELPEDNSND